MSGFVCVIGTGTTYSITVNTVSYVTYAWDSATTGAKTLTISFNRPSNGFTFIVKDEIGTAGTYPISVTPSNPDTIDTAPNQAPFVLNSNFESVTLQCDGAHNWLVE